MISQQSFICFMLNKKCQQLITLFLASQLRINNFMSRDCPHNSLRSDRLERTRQQQGEIGASQLPRQSRIHIQLVPTVGTASPDICDSSVGRRAGFIVSKKRSVSEVSGQSNENFEPTGINSKLKTRFHSSPKPPLPKMKKLRNKLFNISLQHQKIQEKFQNNQISDKNSESIIRQLSQQNFPFGRNTKARAKSNLKHRLKSQSSQENIFSHQNQHQYDTMDAQCLKKELKELLKKKQRLQNLYTRKNHLRKKLDRLNKDLDAIKYQEIVIDKGYDLKAKNLLKPNREQKPISFKKSYTEANDRQNKIKSVTVRQNTIQKEQKDKYENDPKVNKKKTKNGKEEKNCERDNFQDQEFYAHGNLHHKCLECKHFFLKKEDIHIPLDIKKQFLS